MTIDEQVELMAKHTEGGLTEYKKRILREMLERGNKENNADYLDASDHGETYKGHEQE